MCEKCPNRHECKSKVAGRLPLHKANQPISQNEFCQVKCSSGFVCTLNPNHKDEHEAHITVNEIIARWK